MCLCQYDHFREFGIDIQSTVREQDATRVALVDRSLMRDHIIDLLIHDGFALRGVANADAGDATERVIGGVGPSGRLGAAGIDAAHHLAADHTDFVEDEQFRFSKVFLECVELVGVGEVGEVRRSEPVDEPMHRRRVEAEVEGGRPGRGTDADEAIGINLRGQVGCRQGALQFLQGGLHGTGLARACGSEEQESHGLGLDATVHAVEHMLYVVQNHGNKELLVVVAEGIARETLVAVLCGLVLEAVPGRHLACLQVVVPMRIVGNVGCQRINEILKRYLRSLLRDPFGIWIRAPGAVELPGSEIFLLPMIIRAMGFSTLRVMHGRIVLGLAWLEDAVLVFLILVGVGKAGRAVGTRCRCLGRGGRPRRIGFAAERRTRRVVRELVLDLVVPLDPFGAPQIVRVHDEVFQSRRVAAVIIGVDGVIDVFDSTHAGTWHVRVERLSGIVSV